MIERILPVLLFLTSPILSALEADKPNKITVFVAKKIITMDD